MKLLLVSLLISLGSFPAFADKNIDCLMTLGPQGVFDSFVELMTENFMLEVSDAEGKEAFVSEYYKNVFSADAYKDRIIPIYTENYSIDELDTVGRYCTILLTKKNGKPWISHKNQQWLIEFDKSPLHKKYFLIEDKVGNAIMKDIQIIGENTTHDLMDRVNPLW